MDPLPLIALTMGDPAGIGPELCLRAAGDAEVRAACRPVIVGDASVLQAVGERLGLKVPEVAAKLEWGEDEAAGEDWTGECAAPTPPGPAMWDLHGPAVLDSNRLEAGLVQPGRAARETGAASYRYFTWAIRQTLAGRFDAITTAPITKAAWHLAGVEDPGHTEVLGRLTGTANIAMMLYSERICVTLVTCHQRLATVARDLRAGEIRRVTHLARAALIRLRGREPRLAVLGLNPHSGEGGLFGDEEATTIAPAVEMCRREGLAVEGPIPPDAAFMPHALERFDGHIVMYHDQGLIPFKMLALHEGVNVTLGLPIVRTSPDHGTAYDLAWQGRAEPASLIAALRLAARLARPDRESPGVGADQ